MRDTPAMLIPTAIPLRPPADSYHTSKAYFLSDVCVEIPSTDTAVFSARLHGPAGSHVSARAWLANETDGTMAETASPRLNAGDRVKLTVVVRNHRVQEIAVIRIESAPLATEDVVIINL